MIRKPLFKTARRVGEPIFPKTQSPKFSSSQFPERGRGGKRRRGSSEFGTQLTEKQKIRFSYGVSEKQLANYVIKTHQTKGLPSQILGSFLEMRLDNAVFRAGIASTRTLGRQIVSHGHILVNGKRMAIPAYQVKVGDTIGIRTQSLKSPLFIDIGARLEKSRNPSWLTVDATKVEVIVKSAPKQTDMDTTLSWNSVIEFYSRV